ncbi:MAG: YqaJ viral recombinase family protein [Salinibacterium sp.]|nr:YqaJ viral recombinase family protein [Salinibacterium sp.]
MSVKIHDVAQGGDAWKALRAGIPTTSNFAAIMANGAGRKTYMLKLAGEIITGEPAESYTNAAMERGHEMEPEARRLYEFLNDTEVRQVGFITNGPKGCSPDGLIGDAGMYEAKSKAPHILIDTLLKDEFPKEHRAQCQGALWVCERDWIDIHCHWPGMPPLIKRAGRDERYIASLASAISAFNEELAEMVERVRAIGGEREAA